MDKFPDDFTVRNVLAANLATVRQDVYNAIMEKSKHKDKPFQCNVKIKGYTYAKIIQEELHQRLFSCCIEVTGDECLLQIW